MPKTSTITLSALTIKIERDPIVNNIPEIISNRDIAHVSGVFNQKPITAQEGEWAYPYDTMTMLQIQFRDLPRYFSIELQNVSNKPTWNLGTQAALKQAILDIQAVIP